jgi:hypothetical protein
VRFRRERQPNPPTAISFTQVDATEGFDDDIGLQPEDWVPTVPINSLVPDSEDSGLPPVEASPDQVFGIASELSTVRESLPLPSDGVYCAVCHIANIDLAKLRTPCPRCGRELLQFGWD